MKYRVKCKVCDCSIWIRGDYDPSVNALELDDYDRNWDEACEHIQAGDYEIDDEDVLAEELF